MRIGLVVTNQYALGSDVAAQLTDELSMVDAAVELGWDAVAVTQHFLTGAFLHGIDQVAMLGRLVDRTGDLRLVVGVNLLALHNPVVVAEQFASIDVMSGGRLVFGVGLGYRDEEFRAMGIERTSAVRRLEENLAAVVELWTSDAPQVDLEWCRVDGVPLSIRPLQQPRPPILMAADGDHGVRRAARRSDGWMINPHATFSTVERQVELFRSTRAAAGLDPVPVLIAMREVFCAPTREQALELAMPYLGAKYGAYAAWGQDRALPGRERFDIPFDVLEHDRFIIGAPDDCVRMLTPWRDRLGVTELSLRMNWVGMPHQLAAASMRLFDAEVRPAL